MKNMSITYREMFSTLGYHALDIIFGFNSKTLKESEKRNLVRLLNLSEKDEIIKAEIQDILNRDITQDEKREMLLALIQ